jgi:hypothetical protein
LTLAQFPNLSADGDLKVLFPMFFDGMRVLTQGSATGFLAHVFAFPSVIPCRTRVPSGRSSGFLKGAASRGL